MTNDDRIRAFHEEFEKVLESHVDLVHRLARSYRRQKFVIVFITALCAIGYAAMVYNQPTLFMLMFVCVLFTINFFSANKVLAHARSTYAKLINVSEMLVTSTKLKIANNMKYLSGVVPGSICPHCLGGGADMVPTSDGTSLMWVECNRCKGEGWVPTAK